MLQIGLPVDSRMAEYDYNGLGLIFIFVFWIDHEPLYFIPIISCLSLEISSIKSD